MFIGSIVVWPPWWDWMLYIPSITALSVVFVIGRKSTVHKGSRQKWFKGILNHQVIATWIVLSLLYFWGAPSRDGMYYVLIATLAMFVAVASTIRLVYLLLREQ